MTEATIYRLPSTPNGTFGVWVVDEKPFCLSLERPEDGSFPRIPAGTYECNKFQSPKNGDVWLLKDTSPRTMIEIHAANLSAELKGCIAPGRRFGVLNNTPAVLESVPAMNDLRKKLGDYFILTIKDSIC